MKSHEEVVRNPAMQMSEDNQQLVWFKNLAAKNQKKSKALEEILSLVNQKNRQTVEENKIIRLKMKMRYEQNKKEMEYQEQFFKEQFKMIYDARTAEEDKFENMQQEQREMFKQSFANASSTVEDHRVRAEKVEKFIKLQDKEMKSFVEEKETLIRAHEERKHKLWEEAIALEMKFDVELAKMMEKL
ncbi:hypothetical protein K7X08_021324 [Anisodus acutangulus]|uniref:Uncharacterized protein n=1 Tax=Anisodus acutangulus TaxID=402998 RepID=A0A9Q1R8Z7_9SOLA|nr:hypothetical protein K7X08_021324 [Anisodus acutangulus]